MTVQLQQVVAGVVWERRRGSSDAKCLDIRWIRGRSICINPLEAIHVGVQDIQNGGAEATAEGEVEGKASLPVEPLTGFDDRSTGLVLPRHQTSKEHIEFETFGMDTVPSCLSLPAVQLLLKEHSIIYRGQKRSSKLHLLLLILPRSLLVGL